MALQENIPVVDFRDWIDPAMRARFVREIVGLNKVQGVPFKASEILDKIVELTEKSR